MKKILGISLGLVMLIGSVPLGFSEPMNLPDSVEITDTVEINKHTVPKSLYKQIQSGVSQNELVCANTNHVLAERHNGNLACVSERTADRMNWNIVETFEETTKINYDFPLSSKDYPQVNANSEPSMYFGEFDVTLTNLPEVGETAEVIVNFVAEVPIELEGYKIGISLSDEFEFVDVPEDEIIYDTSILSKTAYHKPLDIAVGESAQLSATIKAVKEGMGNVYGFATSEHTYSYWVFVGEEPMLREDYYELYPELEPQMDTSGINQPTVPDTEQAPKEHPAPRPETEPETSSTNSTSPSNPTDDEIREQLRENGLDEELIEEMIKHRNEQRNQTETNEVSTQSFSFLTPAFAQTSIVYDGYLTTSTSPLAPTDKKLISDAHACAWDYDFTASEYLLILCDSTDENGYYSIDPITLPSSSQDGQIDLLISFSTNGYYSAVKDAETKGSSTLGDFYQYIDVSDIWYDPQSSNTYSVELDTDDLTTPNENRAFWLTDGIADARKALNDNFGVDVSTKVDVGWQYDEGVQDGFGLGNGAKYYSSTNTMYMDGYDSDQDRDDDSNERWTTIHEYGHHVMNVIFGSQPSGLCNPDYQTDGTNNPSSHTWNGESSEGCAWREGFSGVLPALVDQSSTYDRSASTLIDFETGTYGTSTLPTSGGELIEGYVATVIWDIYDATDSTETANNGSDDVDSTLSNIGTVYNTSPQDIEDFYTNWENTSGYPDLDNVMLLNYMGFVPTNTAPVANSLTLTVDEDTPTNITLTASDAESDNLTFTIVSQPTNGNLADYFETFTSKTVTYTPDTGFSGTDSFTFMANDGTEDSNTATISITVDSASSTTTLTIIGATIDYDADEIQIQFDSQTDIQFETYDFDIVATLDDSTTQTLSVSSVTNYSVASAYRTVEISGEIPSNTTQISVDILNTNLGGTVVIGIDVPVDSEIIPENY